MGFTNVWDRETFLDHKKKLADTFELCSDRTVKRMNDVCLKDLTDHYDGLGYLTGALYKFKEVTRRLRELDEAMAAYLDDYDAMLEQNRQNAGNVQVQNTVYGSFSGLVSTMAGSMALYEGSKAYQAHRAYEAYQGGKSFPTNYNDLSAFLRSDTYKKAEGFVANSEINNYKLYLQVLMDRGDEYADDRLDDAISAMVETIPGHESLTYTNIDWEMLGEKMGIPELAEIMAPLDLLLEQQKDGALSEDSLKELKGKAEFLEDLAKKRGLKVFSKLAKGLGDIAEKGEIASGGLEYLLNTFFTFANNYSDQVSYLETMKEGLEMSGYWTGSPLFEKINELQAEYDDVVLKAFNESLDMAEDVAMEITKESLIRSVPVVRDVDAFFDLASSASALYGIDKTEAAKSLMGYMQYDEQLTRTYRTYLDMMSNGMADAADVANADRVYEMLIQTKIKEYEAIGTIADEGTHWGDLAREKAENLKELRKEIG